MSDHQTAGEPRPLSELLLAGLGFAALGVEAVDELADDLSSRVGIDRMEMRSALEDALRAVRSDTERASRRGDAAVDRMLARAGLVRREEVDDLALRVAQLEHRLRLLERAVDDADAQ